MNIKTKHANQVVYLWVSGEKGIHYNLFSVKTQNTAMLLITIFFPSVHCW